MSTDPAEVQPIRHRRSGGSWGREGPPRLCNRALSAAARSAPAVSLLPQVLDYEIDRPAGAALSARGTFILPRER